MNQNEELVDIVKGRISAIITYGLLMVPWAIGVTWIINEAERINCTGLILTYAFLAKWVYPGIVLVALVVLLPLSVYYLVKAKRRENTRVFTVMTIVILSLVSIAVFFVWLWSVRALFGKSECKSILLVSLTKFNAMLPLFFIGAFGVKFCFLTCENKDWMRITNEDESNNIEITETKSAAD